RPARGPQGGGAPGPAAMGASAEEYNGAPLPKVAANYAALTPNQFLERAATVFPDRLAVIHGARRLSWSQLYARSRRLASALRREGIGRGDVVTAILSNTPEHLECLHGVPMSGAVLNP
ncbi:unnamed protein product, partial [Prorocentrum cordatum]